MFTAYTNELRYYDIWCWGVDVNWTAPLHIQHMVLSAQHIEWLTYQLTDNTSIYIFLHPSPAPRPGLDTWHSCVYALSWLPATRVMLHLVRRCTPAQCPVQYRPETHVVISPLFAQIKCHFLSLLAQCLSTTRLCVSERQQPPRCSLPSLRHTCYLYH